jgi:hypothetical protein
VAIALSKVHQHNEDADPETMVVTFGGNLNHQLQQVGTKLWLNVGNPAAPTGLAAKVREVNGAQVTFKISD